MSPAPKALSVCRSKWKRHCSGFLRSSFDSRFHLLSCIRNDRLAGKAKRSKTGFIRRISYSMISIHWRGFATACPKKQLVAWLFPILRSHSTDTKVHHAAVERMLAFYRTPLFLVLMYHSTPIHTSAAQRFSQDHIQNILGKVDNHSTEKGHKALRTLTCIVAFQGKTDLHNAEAQ